MRDVILKRSNAGVETWNAEGANFATPLPVPILGQPLPVKRGWTATDASVRGSRPFRFVNTHLESFEPHYRAAQAAELVEPPGPATGPLPVILVGDLNSDDNTVTGADTQAFDLLKVAGFVDLSTESPMSCCINSSELGETDGGNISDFDHHIDHVMTNDPENILLLSSSVTGRRRSTDSGTPTTPGCSARWKSCPRQPRVRWRRAVGLVAARTRRPSPRPARRRSARALRSAGSGRARAARAPRRPGRSSRRPSRTSTRATGSFSPQVRVSGPGQSRIAPCQRSVKRSRSAM